MLAKLRRALARPHDAVRSQSAPPLLPVAETNAATPPGLLGEPEDAYSFREARELPVPEDSFPTVIIAGRRRL